MLAAWRIARWASPGRFEGSVPSTVLILLLASLPATLSTILAIELFGGGPVPFVSFYIESVLLGLAISFVRRGLTGGGGRQTVRAPAAPAKEPPMPDRPGERFLARHAPALQGRKLLALEAEDHYLRIHVVGGSVLVLLRLRDAIETLGETAGWQPHRSFWVSSDVAARAERRGQSWRLVLENGLEVPVSRAALPAMRAAGLASRAVAGQPPARATAVGSTAE